VNGENQPSPENEFSGFELKPPEGGCHPLGDKSPSGDFQFLACDFNRRQENVAPHAKFRYQKGKKILVMNKESGMHKATPYHRSSCLVRGYKILRESSGRNI